MDEIHTAYYLLIEQYSHNPTEQEAEDQYKLQHAYNVLRRQYDDGEAAQPVRDVDTDRRGRMWVMILSLLISGAALLATNWSSIELAMAHLESGTVVRLTNSKDAYGTVLRFDKEHRFHTGNPVPAYEVRLAATGETVWLTKRVIIKGMTPMIPPDDDR